ncbi:MAG: MBOAT family protein [Lachnospiraceae bacterium]|nr:MBOAT family protein [Lachnospiraceae bacterium]
MQFNSTDFMFFYPAVLAVYFLIPKRFRIVWLLISSYFFYMRWNALYILLIAASTLITYLSALLIERMNEGTGKNLTKRKTVMLLCITFNLLILALFKYGNFVIEIINDLLGTAGISQIGYRFGFLLPVGISFYTFQALGYTIDVYRGDIRAEKNIVKYALFVSFFPQLVAGPIERSKNLMGQIDRIDEFRVWNARRIASGAILMIWGLFLKMVLADRISILVDRVYGDYRLYGGTELLIASIAFAIQIYCDFSSYSVIAAGSARVLGIELMENFNTPYFAESIKEFWSRWHISLSTWFKDYLYIPLGGSRKGRLRKLFNLMAVFLVSGIWHGANLTFIVWGLIHGIYRVLEELSGSLRSRIVSVFRIKTDCMSYHFIKVLFTFSLTVFAWIFFRAESVSSALFIVKRIFTAWNPWILFNGGIYELGLDRVEMNIAVCAGLVLLLVSLIRRFREQKPDEFLFEQNIWFEWTVVIALITSIFIFGEYGPAFDAKQFIYFRF